MKSPQKIDLPVLYYKIFLILMFLGQLYPLIFMIGDILTFTFNIILALYIIFRYYMLLKLKGEASRVSLTVTEFIILNRQQIKKINEANFCDKCKFKF
jgi:hypothetical protein